MTHDLETRLKTRARAGVEYSLQQVTDHALALMILANTDQCMEIYGTEFHDLVQELLPILDALNKLVEESRWGS